MSLQSTLLSSWNSLSCCCYSRSRSSRSCSYQNGKLIRNVLKFQRRRRRRRRNSSDIQIFDSIVHISNSIFQIHLLFNSIYVLSYSSHLRKHWWKEFDWYSVVNVRKVFSQKESLYSLYCFSYSFAA